MPSFKNIFKVVGSGQEAQPPVRGSGDVMDRIRGDIASNKILIYMKGDRAAPQCGFSAATIDAFNNLNVPYETRDVLRDPELRQSIKEFSNWPTIPQVYIDGKFIGGCDIVMELHASGELRAMVDKAIKD